MLCTSGFADDVMFSYHGAMGQNQARRYVYEKFARCRYQLDVRQLQRLVEFIRIRHRGRSVLSTIDLLRPLYYPLDCDYLYHHCRLDVVVSMNRHDAPGPTR